MPFSRFPFRPLFVVACLLLGSTLVWAGKPGGGSGGGTNWSLPPVTPNHNFADFEWRPDLGGWLQKSRNVVWGYSVLGLANHGINFDWTLTLNDYYPSLIAENGDRAYANGDYDTAEFCYASAAVAAQYSNWRAPTVDEARDAVAKGLFTYGEGGFNGWTGSPLDEGPGLPYGGGLFRWTSTTGKGKSTAWAFVPDDGSALVIGQGSGIDVMVVRTHTP